MHVLWSYRHSGGYLLYRADSAALVTDPCRTWNRFAEPLGHGCPDRLARGGPLPRPVAARLSADRERRTDSLAATLDRLNRRVEAMRATRCPAGAPAQPADSSDDLAALRAAAAAAAGQAAPADSADTARAVPQADPRHRPQARRGANLLNPEISATGDVRLVAEEGAAGRRAWSMNSSWRFQSALDPYSSTKIFLAASEEGVEIEEGYIYWTGLPGRLRLDVGQVPPAGGRPQPVACARAARDRVPAGLPAILRRRRAGGRGSLPLHRAALLAGGAAPTRSGSRPPAPRATRCSAGRRQPPASWAGCRTSGS